MIGCYQIPMLYLSFVPDLGPETKDFIFGCVIEVFVFYWFRSQVVHCPPLSTWYLQISSTDATSLAVHKICFYLKCTATLIRLTTFSLFTKHCHILV